MSILADRLLAVHAALDGAGFPHAFGGAIALAYCTEEPRGTRDVDVNVFVGAEESARVLDALPAGVVVGEADVRAATEAGQVRVWWDDTPLDLFFDVHDFHREIAADVRVVPFAGTEIPVLGCAALAVFKVVFDRTKDWADLEAMVEVEAFDASAVLGWVVRLFGPDDVRVARLLRLVEPGREQGTGRA
ncbi:MAG: hypothetical protein AB7L84_01710 [Acidimicrobiia bacterium]